jgi:hypothetical protein
VPSSSNESCYFGRKQVFASTLHTPRDDLAQFGVPHAFINGQFRLAAELASKKALRFRVDSGGNMTEDRGQPDVKLQNVVDIRAWASEYLRVKCGDAIAEDSVPIVSARMRLSPSKLNLDVLRRTDAYHPDELFLRFAYSSHGSDRRLGDGNGF